MALCNFSLGVSMLCFLSVCLRLSSPCHYHLGARCSSICSGSDLTHTISEGKKPGGLEETGRADGCRDVGAATETDTGGVGGD